MTSQAVKPVRCAIYTRVSTDAGLDQEFNSLDAQYDASQAYIRSQAHAGWALVKSRYDDGGFSGGSTERPALQQLLADVRARKINVIVVYKVDRLTRSLADFAKLVELFDAHEVSFVSVTQQFNTTTSMGRLTLNVLLSFAQFEREVTAERIRDKIAASKRKGLWVGGMVPLGYQLKDGKLYIDDDEAAIVRLIFSRYLDLGSVNHLVADLTERGLRSKVRKLSNGATRGGVLFTQGALFYMLRNRFYVGQVSFKGEVLPGPQPALLEPPLFEAVQQKLTEQWGHRNRTKQRNQMLLVGLLFDDAGHPMVTTYAVKNRVRYRYYMSAPLRRGHSDIEVGSVSRVPAEEVEDQIERALLAHFNVAKRGSIESTDIVRAKLQRAEVREGRIVLQLRHGDSSEAQADDDGGDDVSSQTLKIETITINWVKPPMRRFREVIQPASANPKARVAPARAKERARLITAIALGKRWLNEVVESAISTEDLAVREKCSVRQIELTISLAFLAPDLVKAAIEGRLPRGIGIVQLRDAPPVWSQQYEQLGLSIPAR